MKDENTIKPNTTENIQPVNGSTPPVSTGPVPPVNMDSSVKPATPNVSDVTVTSEVKQSTTSAAPARKLNIPKIDPKNIVPMIKAAPFKFKLIGGFVLLLVVLLILASFTKPGKKVVERLILASPSPVPTITPIGEVFVPSPYANDPEILDIESRLSEVEKKIGGTTLGEDTLRPPSLDWDVNFKQ